MIHHARCDYLHFAIRTRNLTFIALFTQMPFFVLETESLSTLLGTADPQDFDFTPRAKIRSDHTLLTTASACVGLGFPFVITITAEPLTTAVLNSFTTCHETDRALVHVGFGFIHLIIWRKRWKQKKEIRKQNDRKSIANYKKGLDCTHCSSYPLLSMVACVCNGSEFLFKTVARSQSGFVIRTKGDSRWGTSWPTTTGKKKKEPS